MRGLTVVAAMLLAGPATAQVSAVRINGVGYAPNAPKRAIVEIAAKRPLAWQVNGADGRVLLRGRTVPYGRDAASGRTLHRADFSALRKAADGLTLKVGTTTSPRFAVVQHPYAPLARDALAYFYHNRAGTPIEARLVGERWARPAAHTREYATCVSGKDARGNDWPNCGYAMDVTGGWYDAGDHGKYVVNGGIATWTLLNLHERLPERYGDNSLRVPEANNGTSDLLDEARWEVEFLLRMQVPAGRRMRLPVDQSDASKPLCFSEVEIGGMAHHKVADRNWTGLPMRPDRDREDRVLHPPSTAATLNLAAIGAQCARVWRTIDPAFAKRCREVAERAWAAAERNPAIYFVSDFTGSGNYGDSNIADERFWAAAELYATTLDPSYLTVVRDSPFLRQAAIEPGWPSVSALGLVTLALSDTPFRAEARTRIIAAADGWSRERDRTGFAVPFAGTRFAWGSNSNLLNRAMLIGLAHDWTRAPRYRAAVVDTMDYLLGRNPVGRSYVSGYGPDPMKAPHHRFWAAGIDPTYPPAPPGALSGGPNNTGTRGDGVEGMPADCAPMLCWADNARAFALNEVAINWNAPLAWVATWLDATEPDA
jgi:endoglucanase